MSEIKSWRTGVSFHIQRHLSTGTGSYVFNHTPGTISSANLATGAGESYEIATRSDTNVPEPFKGAVHEVLAFGAKERGKATSLDVRSEGQMTTSTLSASQGINPFITTSPVPLTGSLPKSSKTTGIETVVAGDMNVNSLMEQLLMLTEQTETAPITKLAESPVLAKSTITSVQTETLTRALLGQKSPSGLKCGNPNDLPGHSDADPQFVRTSSFDWCFLPIVEGVMQAGDECVVDVQRSWHDVLYEYSICWERNCVGKPQDKRKPLGEDGPRCESILYEDCWQACHDNEGVGGKVQAGCLVYQVRAGVGASEGY
jgi:hypothetical protein